MAEASIPVDIFNPGQVFACMGFLEAAEVLLGSARGGFDWREEPRPTFTVVAAGSENPIEAVLRFLVRAELKRVAPLGYADPKQNNSKRASFEVSDGESEDGPLLTVEVFPAQEADYLALPLRFEADGQFLNASHWCDGSSRNPFKLFAGLQRSAAIARQMLAGVRSLWESQRAQLIRDPMGLTLPLGGSSFKFDARKAWTTIDAGYSPDEQKNAVEASPVVELLAAIGLEHARPDEFATRQVRYAIWQGLLPPILARAVLGTAPMGFSIRILRFVLDLAGKNKNVTFAEEEVYS